VDLNRREVLGLGLTVTAGGFLAACSSPDPPAAAPTEQTPNLLATPDLELIALYMAVRSAYPALDASLQTIEEQHRAHLAALGGEVSIEDIDVTVATTSAAAVEQCMLAERRAADIHQAACLRSADPVEVRLLALISASEASHVPALERLL
jgi:hypothetical protein